MKIDKILVVDDSDANLLYFDMVFSEVGYPKIFKAKTGHHGLEMIEKEQIQLVVVAWELTGLTGTLFLQKARAHRRRRYLPCVLYSKRMNDEDIKLVKELGFENIIGMPFVRTEVKALLKKVIDGEENLNNIESTLRKIESLADEDHPTEALKLMSPRLEAKGPSYPRALTVMASVWYQINRLDRCEECLNKAINFQGDFVPALQLKARMLSKMGRHEEAIAMLEKMSATSPKNISTMLGLGSAYVDADRHQDAAKVFGKVQAIDKDNQDCKDQMAKVAFKEGDITLAAKLIAETENGSELGRYFNNLAVSLVARGDIPRAVDTYQKAIKLLGASAHTHLLHYNLGLAYKKSSQFDKAIQEFGASYLIDPTYEKAYLAFAKLVTDLKSQGKTIDSTLVQKVKSAKSKLSQSQTPANEAA